MRQRLVMVMGMQRSGTNALFNSLAADPRYRSHNESDDSALFLDWNLRPEVEVRSILCAPGPVLLKPVNETDFREVIDVLGEYREYEVWIPWIYRDPVNVHSSWWTKWGMPPVDQFIAMWNRRNRSILSALSVAGPRVGIVRYEDLIEDRRVFERMSEFFAIDGDYQFHADSEAGRKTLPRSTIEWIDEGTADVRQQLDARRLCTPTPVPERPMPR